MTISLPDGWQARFEEPSAVHLLAPGQDIVATISLRLPPSSGAGWGRAFQRGTREHQRRFFDRNRGRMNDFGGEALLDTTLATGRGTIRNGSSEGWRRESREGVIEIDGRTYLLRHTSRWSTDIRRDGRTLATARRRVLSSRRRRLARIATPEITRPHPLEPLDELVVLIAATICGPPGRSGLLATAPGGLVRYWWRSPLPWRHG